jgi:hypothetical protein
MEKKLRKMPLLLSSHYLLLRRVIRRESRI